jgi:hypothetical protein
MAMWGDHDLTLGKGHMNYHATQGSGNNHTNHGRVRTREPEKEVSPIKRSSTLNISNINRFI